MSCFKTRSGKNVPATCTPTNRLRFPSLLELIDRHFPEKPIVSTNLVYLSKDLKISLPVVYIGLPIAANMAKKNRKVKLFKVCSWFIPSSKVFSFTMQQFFIMMRSLDQLQSIWTQINQWRHSRTFPDQN